MKWIFFALIGLNLALASMQWWDIRKGEQPERYVSDKNVSKLVLLQEQEMAQPSSKQEEALQCELLGPMQNKEAAESLIALLELGDTKASLVVQKTKKAPGYWVYFGPIAERTDRLAKLREFQSKGIDSYLIATGDLKDSISLGVFDNIDSARRMEKIMSGHGYLSKLSEIEKNSEEYWLLISDPYSIENKKKIDDAVGGLESRPDRRQIFCKNVASEKQFP